MKKLLLICSLFLLGNTTTKATSLNAGDIAISSVNSDDTDDFSFVLLTPISGTTTIYFTDNGWDDDANGTFANPTWRGITEGTITWTFTGALPCGTEIQITTPTGLANQGTVIKTGSFNLSSTKDHLLAYTGISVPNDGTEITNFITAFGLGTTGWSSNASTTSTSALPPGLTDGVDAIATLNSSDNFQYDCSTLSPVAALRTALVTVANYTAGSSNNNYQAPGCSYSCAVPCIVTNSSFSVTECTAYTVPSGDETYTTVGTSTVADTIPNSCGSDSIIAITITILPALTGNNNSTICATGSIVINGNTYDAATPSGTEVFTVGPNNCDSTVTIALNVLSALTGNNSSTICATGSVVVNGNTYDAATPSGTEVFTVGPNNCDSTVTVALNVLPALTGSVTNTICATGSVVVNGNTYDAATPTGTEVFTVGPNNCDSTVTVALNVLPALTGSVTNTICATGSVVVNGNTYDAATPTGTEVFTVGPNNCDSTVTIALNVLPVIDNSITTTGTTLTANQTGATYQWLDCDNGNAIITGETSVSFTATSNGNYAVEITTGSCIDTSVCVNIATVGINEAANNLGLSIYPNPNKGIFTLNIKAKNVVVEIMNTQGQIVLTKNNVNTNQQIDLSNNAKGIYFVTVTSNQAVTTQKVIVQ